MMSDPRRLDLALKDADDAIMLNPGSAQGWMQKGEVLQAMGDTADAIDVFSNSVGCAQPHERLAAERALAAARQQAGAGASANLDQQIPQIIQPSVQPASATSLYSSPVSISSPTSPISQSTNSAPRANSPTSGGLFPSMSSMASTTASLSPGLSPPLEQPRATTPSALASAPSPPAQTTFSPPSNTTEDPSRRTSLQPSGAANRSADITRTTQTVNRNAATTTSHVIPQSLFEGLSPPDGPPPAYTEHLRDPVVLSRKFDELEEILRIKNKGSLLVQPYTLPGQIDAVRLLYSSMTADELTARETGSVVPVHPKS
ncbi:hypothetical protein BDW69DRAFT_149006 [Aspergillus filifer]